MAESEVTTEVKQDVESPSKKSSQGSLDIDAFHNFLQGKRHILVQDYTHAVGSLAKACELYVEHYGQTAIECAEVYFHYGKALFRLFQQQAGILGNVLPDGSEEEEDEEEEEEEGESNEADSEEDKEKEGAETASNENGEVEEEDIGEDSEDSKKAESDTDAKPEAKETKAEEEVKRTKDSESDNTDIKVEESKNEKIEINEVKSSKDALVTEKQNTENASGSSSSKEQEMQPVNPESTEAGPSGLQPPPEDEISDLQLAWETLETAKSIFMRQGDDKADAQLKVAEILLILAEISMELENYSSAVIDLDECLCIREKHLKPDDRLIAETYYQIALAHTYDSKVAPAIENYQKSIDVIQLRTENLKKQTVIEKNEDGFDIDPSIEISELEDILKDIKAKMEDTQDMIQDAKKIVKELVFQPVEEAPSSSDKPVSNISHLLKRKKPEDSGAAKPIEVKRIKLSSTENGKGPESPDVASPPKV